MNQHELNNYFSTKWRSQLDEYIYSGWELIGQFHPDEHILDVGFGFNEFKPKVPNLIGIDPANDKADHKVSIEDFSTFQKFNVALCLGSINFGTEDTIKKQIECVIRLLRNDGRIYWRCNPGVYDHGNEECNDIQFFPWTFDKHLELAEFFGYKVSQLEWDSNNRIYAEWHRGTN